MSIKSPYNLPKLPSVSVILWFKFYTPGFYDPLVAAIFLWCIVLAPLPRMLFLAHDAYYLNGQLELSN